jgi:ABC-type uncharacterized transport system ATPase subunit
MMDVITGKTRPDKGKCLLRQTIDLTRSTKPRSRTLGIGRKFQKPTVFEKPHRVREPRARDEGRQARLRTRCSRG